MTETKQSTGGGARVVPAGWQLVPKNPTREMLHVMRYGEYDAQRIAIDEEPIIEKTPWPRFGEHLARDAYQSALRIAPVPVGAPAPVGLVEAVRAHLAAVDDRARHDDEPTPDDPFGLIHVGETLKLDEAVSNARGVLDAALTQPLAPAPAVGEIEDPRDKVSRIEEKTLDRLERMVVERDETIARLRAECDALAGGDGWRTIETAPYGQEVEVRAGSMCFLARLERDASIGSDGKACDQWRATREGEHPPSWSEGACWESNAHEAPSLQPTHWRPLPPPPARPDTTRQTDGANNA